MQSSYSNDYIINQSVSLAEKSENEYLDIFLQKLGIEINSETDPKLLTEILQDDMQLYDMIEIREIFGKKLFEKQSLKPFIEQIIIGLKKKHPAIIEFIITLIKKNIFEKINENAKRMIKRSLHHTYLLEEITKNMYNDITFNEKIVDFMIKKRNKIYHSNSKFISMLKVYKITGLIFLAVKTILMDISIHHLINLRKKNKTSFFELIKLRVLLVLNILEAAFTDFCAGFRKNAFCGFALAFKLLKGYSIEGKNQHLKFYLSQEWCSLYTTWNFAFMSGNLINLPLLYPKLLIPCVINSEPSSFLAHRAYALWLSLNFGLWARVSKNIFEMPQSKEIAKIWEDINLKYGKEFISKKQRTVQTR